MLIWDIEDIENPRRVTDHCQQVNFITAKNCFPIGVVNIIHEVPHHLIYQWDFNVTFDEAVVGLGGYGNYEEQFKKFPKEFQNKIFDLYMRYQEYENIEIAEKEFLKPEELISYRSPQAYVVGYYVLKKLQVLLQKGQLKEAETLYNVILNSEGDWLPEIKPHKWPELPVDEKISAIQYVLNQYVFAGSLKNSPPKWEFD
jgi:hypothetical protein